MRIDGIAVSGIAERLRTTSLPRAAARSRPRRDARPPAHPGHGRERADPARAPSRRLPGALPARQNARTITVNRGTGPPGRRGRDAASSPRRSAEGAPPVEPDPVAPSSTVKPGRRCSNGSTPQSASGHTSTHLRRSGEASATAGTRLVDRGRRDARILQGDQFGVAAMAQLGTQTPRSRQSMFTRLRRPPEVLCDPRRDGGIGAMLPQHRLGAGSRRWPADSEVDRVPVATARDSGDRALTAAYLALDAPSAPLPGRPDLGKPTRSPHMRARTAGERQRARPRRRPRERRPQASQRHIPARSRRAGTRSPCTAAGTSRS